MTSPWETVLAATEGHNIDKVNVHLDDGKSWTYIYCTCGNEPDREAFTESWEFTDHIRRLVFNALTPREKDPDGRDDPEWGHLVDSDIRP